MHNVKPLNSNKALITANIMGHKSYALPNGIINCVTQQSAPSADKQGGVSKLTQSL